MKVYKIKITLRDSNPLIWREVIVQSQITFEKLHYIIQFAMGWENSYLYDFNILKENLRITCDEETIAKYNFYSKIQLTKDNDPYGHIEEYIKIKPILSHKVKIDNYIMQYQSIEYVYDFGDYWKHDISLVEILEDYVGFSPICIAGEGACPPEDIGGILEYKEFLKIINDKDHPEYKRLIIWVKNNSYKETFDNDDINYINNLMVNEFK